MKSYQDKRFYAIKKIDLSNVKPKKQKESLNEVALLKQVRHPHIVEYYTSFLEVHLKVERRPLHRHGVRGGRGPANLIEEVPGEEAEVFGGPRVENHAPDGLGPRVPPLEKHHSPRHQGPQRAAHQVASGQDRRPGHLQDPGTTGPPVPDQGG